MRKPKIIPLEYCDGMYLQIYRYWHGNYTSTINGDYEYCGRERRYSLTVRAKSGRTLMHYDFRAGGRIFNEYRPRMEEAKKWANSFHSLAKGYTRDRYSKEKPWVISCDDIDSGHTICPHVHLRSIRCKYSPSFYGYGWSGDGSRPLPADYKCDLAHISNILTAPITRAGLSFRDLFNIQSGEAWKWICEEPKEIANE